MQLLPLYLLAFLVFGSIAMLFPVMPPFAASLGADVTQVGFIIALQLYVAGLLVVPVGIVSDRLGRSGFFIAGIALSLISQSMYLFSSNLPILIAARVVGGLAGGALYPASSSMVVDAVPAEKRGQALGTLTTCSQLGSMLGPAAGGIILKNYGYTAVFLSSLLVMALALVICLTRIKIRRPAAAQAGSRERGFRWLGERRNIAALLSILVAMVGVASINSFLPLYGPEIGIDIGRVGLIVGTVYLGSALMRATGGWLSDRAGRAPVMLSGLFLGAGGIFMVSLFATPLSLHLAALLFGLGVGLSLPASAALLADTAPPSMRGLSMGLYAAAFHAGQAFGATGLGYIVPAAGFKGMYLATAAAIAAALVAVVFLTGKQRRGEPERPA